MIGPGDSGGPGFIDGAIAGVSISIQRAPFADVTDTLDNSWGEAGISSRASAFRDFLTAATGGTAVFLYAGPRTTTTATGR